MADHLHDSLDRRQGELDDRQNERDCRQTQLDFDVKTAIERCQTQLSTEWKAVLAVEWDNVAIGLRLATLEDQMETLLSPEADREPSLFSKQSAQAVIRYRGPSTHAGTDKEMRVVGNHAKAN
jgi:hypothetical protein